MKIFAKNYFQENNILIALLKRKKKVENLLIFLKKSQNYLNKNYDKLVSNHIHILFF